MGIIQNVREYFRPSKNGHAKPINESAMDRLSRLVESMELSGSYVDPRGAYLDNNGEAWLPIGGLCGAEEQARACFTNEQELAEARCDCRQLARTSAYAINAHENRVSYIVGTGHKYTVTAKKGAEVNEEAIAAAQEFLDEWLYEQNWCRRQAEIIRRIDRDGECFLRLFVTKQVKDAEDMASSKTLTVRFVEPADVSTPQDKTSDPSATFGVKTDPQDVETVEGYYVSGQFVDAKYIQHRKPRADSNVKRGTPLLWSVRHTLRQIEKIRRNMAIASSIQTSVAGVKQVEGVTKTAAENARASAAEYSRYNTATGKTDYYQEQKPGRIITTGANTTYTFPWEHVNYSTYVEVIADSLREVASLLCMPEFMLTSDASNANYSSTMVAEGPAVKRFEREQATTKEYDLEILWRVIKLAIDGGILPKEIEEQIEIQIQAPTLKTRNETEEFARDKGLVDMNVMSRQTLAGKYDLDFEQEQTNIDAWEKDHPAPTFTPGANPFGDNQDGEQKKQPPDSKGLDKDALEAVIRGVLSASTTPDDARVAIVEATRAMVK